jgi:hypothetical protein
MQQTTLTRKWPNILVKKMNKISKKYKLVNVKSIKKGTKKK